MEYDLSDLQVAAALCEQAYRRNDEDQQIADTTQGFGTSKPLDNVLQTVAGLEKVDGFYYNDATGFVGRIVEANGKIFVVLRGSDVSGGGLDIVQSVAWGASDYADPGDWQCNIALGWGSIGQSQLGDALALVAAAQSAASGAEVIVTGQSLAGGLTCLVTALTGTKGIAIAPAPFQNQMEIEATLHALDNAGITRTEVATVLNTESWIVDLALQLHIAPLTRAALLSSLINADLVFRTMLSFIWGKTDLQIESILEDRQTILTQFEEQLHGKLEIHRIEGEALSGGPIAAAIDIGADSFDYAVGPDRIHSYDVGPDGSSVSKHSPALHNLVIRTDTLSGKEFANLLKSDAAIRQAFLDETGIVGPLGGDRADPDTSTSKMAANGPNTAIVYNALWKTVGTTNGFYDQFYSRFHDWLSYGAAAEGKSTTGVADNTLHTGLVRLGLQVVRDAIVRSSSGDVVGAAGLNVFGEGDGDSPSGHYVRIHLDDITASDLRLQDAYGHAFGVSDIDIAVYSRIAGSITGFSYAGQQVVLQDVTGVLDELSLHQGAGLRPWATLVVQAGTADVPDAALHFGPGNAGDFPAGTIDRMHLIIGGTGDDEIEAGHANDYILGGAGEDTLKGGDGDDVLVGESGEDRLFGGAGDNRLLGGGGTDTAVYESGSDQGVHVGISQVYATEAADPIAVVGTQDNSEVDRLINVERLELTGKADTVSIGVLPEPLDLEIDAGGQDPGTSDTLDLHDYESPSGSGIDMLDGKLESQPDLIFQNFEVLKGTDRADVIRDTVGFKEVDLGAGDDVVDGLVGSDLTAEPPPEQGPGDPPEVASGAFLKVSFSAPVEGSGPIEDNSRDHWVRVFLGAGKDVVRGNIAKGSEIDLGSDEDQDIIYLSSDTLTSNVGANDILFKDGYRLLGGSRNIESDSPYAYTPFGGTPIRYALNFVGQLAIDGIGRLTSSDPGDYRSWIDNYDQANHAGGLDLVEYSWEAKRFVDLFHSSTVWKISGSFALVLGHFLKQTTGISLFGGVDPLSFDLDGDGLELTTLSYNGKLRFDMDGDFYAEPTGWVRPDDGMLVNDANHNGAIDDVSELFGDASMSGFGELAAYDTNEDGVVDGTEASELRIWRDLDQDGKADAGELFTLAEAGIATINVAGTPRTNVENSGHTVAAEGTFTRTDESTGHVFDIRFQVDNFHTTYTGDNSISATVAASGLPEIKGRGTLTDFRVALTLDEAAKAEPGYQGPDLAVVTAQQLALMTGNDLSAWRAAAQPIFEAWADVSPLHSGQSVEWWADSLAPDGITHGGLGGRPDLHLVVQDTATGTGVVDFLYLGWVEVDVEDPETHQVHQEWQQAWKFGSGRAIVDENGDPIDAPTLSEALATDLGSGERFDTITGGQLAFLERFMGEELRLGSVVQDVSGALAGFTPIIELFYDQLNSLVIKLAVQGPLADTVFAGIAYDKAEDDFNPTTDRGLVPVFEAIFEQIPSGSGATDFVEAWSKIMDFVISDFDRGDDYLVITPSWIFANIVAAYETASPPVGIRDLAGAFCIDESVIRIGAEAGTNDVDMYYLGAGDQTVNGGDGQDSYVIGGNFGHDTIAEYEAPQHAAEDTVRFASTMSTDVTAYRDGIDLVINVNGSNDQLRITGQFTGTKVGIFGVGGKLNADEGVAFVIFSDGVVWDRSEIARQVSHPDAGGVDVIGTDATDFLEGGAGDETLSGRSGSDVYVFGAGYGHDTISDLETLNSVSDFPDFLVFRGDLGLEDLVFTRSGTSHDLTIGIAGTNDTITIIDQFTATYPGVFEKIWLSSVDQFGFENGRTYSAEDIAKTIVARAETDGNDTIYGFSYEDRLDGGKGDDHLSGGNENDTYVFGLGYGHDTIKDSTGNYLSGTTDTVEFGRGVKFSETTFSRIGGSDDLLITLQDGSTLTIEGQFDATSTGVFGNLWGDRIERFVFRNGTGGTFTYTYAQLMDDLLTPTPGDDVLYGYVREDVLDGGAGDDFLSGRLEGDTYVFGRGYGHDTIKDNEGSYLPAGPNIDRVQLLPGVTPGDVVVERTANEDDLVLRIVDTGDTLTLSGQVWHTTINFHPDQIEEVVFDNGAVWTAADLCREYLADARTGSNDLIIGFFRNDIIDGGAGDDVLKGRDGADTYIFGRGSGHDTIVETVGYVTYSDDDRVSFGAGISFEDLGWTRDGNDLVITINDTGETLRIIDQYAISVSFAWNDVEFFDFVGGVTWSKEQIAQWVIEHSATPGDDTIVGTSGSDVLDGGAGNDILKAGDGADTYLFGRGSGNDRIEESVSYVSYSDDDHVYFGPGIAITDLTFSRGTGKDLLITINDTGETLTIVNHFRVDGGSFTFYDIEHFDFANGSTFTKAEIGRWMVEHSATAGDDTIVGTPDPDVIDGGAGTDFLSGQGGGDTYVFGRYYGHDTIEDNGSLSGLEVPDRIVFDDDVRSTDVVVSRNANANDLVLTIIDTGDSLTLKNQVEHNTSGNRYDEIEQVVFGDATWTPSDLRVRYLAAAKTAGSDTIVGFFSDDLLDGGAGDDILRGGDGSDTYLFGLGSGHDRIEESVGYVSYADDDRVTFGAGIQLADVRWTRPGNNLDLLVSIVPTGETLFVVDHFAHSAGFTFNDIETFSFADGTTVSKADIQGFVLRDMVTTGDDTIVGFDTDDTIRGGLGNDTLSGVDGADTLEGDEGSDRLHGGNGNDTLRGGAGDDWLIDSAGVDIFDGGDGADTIDLINTSNPFTLDLQAGTLNWGSSVETLIGIENVNGSWGANTVYGDDHNNQLLGNPGNDTLSGGAGDDYLDGGDDTDAVDGGEGDDTVLGGNGNDHLIGGMGNDSLSGGSGNDTIEGSAGDDYIVGGSGTDTMDGGDGVDTVYFGDSSSGFNINIATGVAGAETAINFENVIGSGGANTITGTDAANLIVGGKGVDTLYGAGGGDTYRWYVGDGDDLIREVGGVVDTDRLAFVGIAPGALTLTRLMSNDIDLRASVSGGGVITVDDHFVGSDTGIEEIAFDDGTVWNRLAIQSRTIALGGSGNDVYTGHAYDEFLQGGLGNDTLNGAGGSDTYIWTQNDGTDFINESGSDIDSDRLWLVDLNAGGVSLTRSMANDAHLYVNTTQVTNHFVGRASGIEEILLADGTVWDRAFIQANAVIKGGSGSDNYTGHDYDDIISGLAGNDVLHGAGGNDTIYGGSNNDTLYGEAGNDWLYGNNEGDTLDGGIGADTMAGGADNDTYVVDEIGDVVIEVAGEGTDTVQSWIAYSLLGTNLENLTLLGAAAIDGRGSAVANTLTGNSAANALFGEAGNDTLNGGGGNDVIDGGYGDDSISGGDGDDLMVGGIGFDSFNGGNGIDTVDFGAASGDWTFNLASGVVVFGGTSKSLTATENVIAGAGNDTITGGTGANRLEGGAGNDTIDGREGDDAIFGGDGDDLVNGNAGVDVLDGGSGNDTVTYSYTTSALDINLGTGVSGGDTIVNFENAVGSQGVNTIIGTSGVNLLDGQGGNDSISGLDGDDQLLGGAGNDILDGGAGSDRVDGGDGNDTLTGGSGDDVLIGGAGTDSFNGGDGVDTADFGSATTAAILNLVAGTALVSGVTETLTAIENLTSGSGNDTLTGNTAANRLDAGAGNDSLTGGAGADVFVARAGFGLDTIVDFGIATDDVIEFGQATFSSFASVLAAASQSGADTLITLDATNVLTLKNVAMGDLSASDFLFV